MKISFNSDIFFDFIGRLKLATVLLGLIDLILTGISYKSSDSRDQAFLAIIIICFFLSLFWVISVMFGLIVIQDSHIKFDIIYHICCCFLLLVTGIFFMISMIKHGAGVIKVLAMVLGFANSAIYGYLPWKLLKTS